MNENKMSVGQWMLTLLVVAIPVVNIIMLCVWAFGGDNDRKNWAKAQLVWLVIGIVLMFIFYGTIASALF